LPTLVVDEPQVESEIAPQVATRKNGDDARQTDFSTELSVKLTPTFSVVLHPAFTSPQPGGNGFQNLETGIKYQFVADKEHDVVFSGGSDTSWSGVGARRVGAEPYTTISPTIYFGKRAGDLPEIPLIGTVVVLILPFVALPLAVLQLCPRNQISHWFSASRKSDSATNRSELSGISTRETDLGG
jgi:hypothetical protein